MFTGIVQAKGRLLERSPAPTGARLLIHADAWEHAPATGDSIAVDGCCLTLAEPAADARLAFDAVHETLSRTTLAGLAIGDTVHLEHAATPTTLLGGHILQGHVDGVAQVLGVQPGDDYRLRFAPPPDLMQYVSPKGAVGVAGVSLTVADLDPDADRPWFDVALIPTTLDKTTLATLTPGDQVNFEADMLNKMAVHWLRHYGR